MLEAVTAVLHLIGTAITGVTKLTLFLFRKLFLAAKPQP